MIDPSTKMQWMDLNNQKVYIDSMHKLFQMYSHKAKNVTSEISLVTFDPEKEKVHITDYLGWTQIVSIRRRCKKNTSLCIIGIDAPNSPELQCTEDTLIPVYYGEGVVGFHGEMKYPFVVKRADDILLDGTDLIKVCWRPEGKPDPFYRVKPIGFAQESIPVYQILTRSGFYSANYFHLWARKEIPTDYCEVCSVNETQNCAGCRKEKI